LLISSVQLMVLFKRCPSCGLELNSSITRVVNGSALVLKWNCERCDGPQTWSSQPKLKGRFFEGNIKLVCSAHTTALPISVCYCDLYTNILSILSAYSISDMSWGSLFLQNALCAIIFLSLWFPQSIQSTAITCEWSNLLWGTRWVWVS